MVVSGKRFMLLTTHKGAVSDLVEVYGMTAWRTSASTSSATTRPLASLGRSLMGWNTW